MNGKFIVQLAENINKIFKVKTSKLLDDSRLPICLENSDNTAVVSLKTIKLLQIGKTWYEKEAGFKLEDTKQYELAKKVQKIPLSSFLNIATNSNLHTMTESYINSTEDLKSIKQIERIETILKKVNLSKESTFQEIARNIFDFSNPEIKNCEKLEIWRTIISNNLVRKKVETLKEIPTWWEPQPSQKDIDNYKILTKWWPAASNWAASTSKKIYEYPIERPTTSSRPSTKYGKRPRTARRPSTAFGKSVISSTTKKNAHHWTNSQSQKILEKKLQKKYLYNLLHLVDLLFHLLQKKPQNQHHWTNSQSQKILKKKNYQKSPNKKEKMPIIKSLIKLLEKGLLEL